jgi:hypothetical protein
MKVRKQHENLVYVSQSASVSVYSASLGDYSCGGVKAQKYNVHDAVEHRASYCRIAVVARDCTVVLFCLPKADQDEYVVCLKA